MRPRCPARTVTLAAAQVCTTCIARLIFHDHDHPIFKRTKHGHRRLLRENEIAAGELDAAVNLKTQGHRRGDVDWEMQKNHLTRLSDDDDDGGG